MLLQVFSEEDKNKLLSKGLRLIHQQQMDDRTVYIFEYNKLNFEDLGIKYKITNKLWF